MQQKTSTTRPQMFLSVWKQHTSRHWKRNAAAAKRAKEADQVASEAKLRAEELVAAAQVAHVTNEEMATELDFSQARQQRVMNGAKAAQQALAATQASKEAAQTKQNNLRLDYQRQADAQTNAIASAKEKQEKLEHAQKRLNMKRKAQLEADFDKSKASAIHQGARSAAQEARVTADKRQEQYIKAKRAATMAAHQYSEVLAKQVEAREDLKVADGAVTEAAQQMSLADSTYEAKVAAVKKWKDEVKQAEGIFDEKYNAHLAEIKEVATLWTQQTEEEEVRKLASTAAEVANDALETAQAKSENAGKTDTQLAQEYQVAEQEEADAKTKFDVASAAKSREDDAFQAADAVLSITKAAAIKSSQDLEDAEINQKLAEDEVADVTERSIAASTLAETKKDHIETVKQEQTESLINFQTALENARTSTTNAGDAITTAITTKNSKKSQYDLVNSDKIAKEATAKTDKDSYDTLEASATDLQTWMDAYEQKKAFADSSAAAATAASNALQVAEQEVSSAVQAEQDAKAAANQAENDAAAAIKTAEGELQVAEAAKEAADRAQDIAKKRAEAASIAAQLLEEARKASQEEHQLSESFTETVRTKYDNAQSDDSIAETMEAQTIDAHENAETKSEEVAQAKANADAGNEIAAKAKIDTHLASENALADLVTPTNNHVSAQEVSATAHTELHNAETAQKTKEEVEEAAQEQKEEALKVKLDKESDEANLKVDNDVAAKIYGDATATASIKEEEMTTANEVKVTTESAREKALSEYNRLKTTLEEYAVEEQRLHGVLETLQPGEKLLNEVVDRKSVV